jgi:hypothetical protein
MTDKKSTNTPATGISSATPGAPNPEKAQLNQERADDDNDQDQL